MGWPSGAVSSLTLRKSISASRHLGLEFREARVHLLLLLPPGGHVLDHGGRAGKLAGRRAEEDDVELDGDARAILLRGRHGQRVPAILRDSARHDSGPAFPVPGSLALGHDQVQRLSERLFCRVSEHSLGSGVPKADLPVAIREQDRYRAVLDDLLIQPALVSGFGHGLLLRRLSAPPTTTEDDAVVYRAACPFSGSTTRMRASPIRQPSPGGPTKIGLSVSSAISGTSSTSRETRRRTFFMASTSAAGWPRYPSRRG